MATHEVLKLGIDAAGEATKEVTGQIDLAEKVFDASVKPRYFYEVVKYIQARRRAGTASTLTRGMVRGGGRKPYRQKGTGRARHGSRRSPLWRGGSIIFGPQPRDWSYRINKKLKKNALLAAITARRKEGRLILVEKFDLPGIFKSVECVDIAGLDDGSVAKTVVNVVGKSPLKELPPKRE